MFTIWKQERTQDDGDDWGGGGGGRGLTAPLQIETGMWRGLAREERVQGI